MVASARKKPISTPPAADAAFIGRAPTPPRFERRLAQAGVDAARVEAMICPIGIGGIRSKHPAAIAVSVAAQLITLDEALSASATHGILPARNAG